MSFTFIDLFNPFDKTIFITVGIEVKGPLSSVNIGDLLPAVDFSWSIVVDGSELEWLSDSEVEFVLTVLIVILDLFHDIP